MSMSDKTEPVGVRVLREYANALRGDWGSIDGRSEKISINAIADAIVADEPPTIEALRAEADLCPQGGGHWTEHCYPDSPGYCAPKVSS